MYKIMIVEDDEIISNSIAGYLEKWQYSTCEVQNFQNNFGGGLNNFFL